MQRSVPKAPPLPHFRHPSPAHAPIDPSHPTHPSISPHIHSLHYLIHIPFVLPLPPIPIPTHHLLSLGRFVKCQCMSHTVSFTTPHTHIPSPHPHPNRSSQAAILVAAHYSHPPHTHATAHIIHPPSSPSTHSLSFSTVSRTHPRTRCTHTPPRSASHPHPPPVHACVCACMHACTVRGKESCVYMYLCVYVYRCLSLCAQVSVSQRALAGGARSELADRAVDAVVAAAG